LNSESLMKLCVEALEEKKASDVTILDISKISIIADYMIIASGTNKNQIQAMADNILEKIHSKGIVQNSIEGYDNASWILIDSGDIIVHIFDKENRGFYNIERLYKDAEILA